MADNTQINSSEDTTQHKPSFISQNRFIIMIFGTVVLAVIMVTITISLYFSSGTAQLDQSRPGYQSLRGKTRQEDTFNAFPATGPVTDSTLGDFKQMYDKRANDATSVDAFDSGVLSDQALSIDDDANATSN